MSLEAEKTAAVQEDESEAIERVSPASLSTRLAEFAWQRIDSEMVADCRVFQVRRDRSRSPRDAKFEHDFYCIEAPDWINIVPLTERNEVVLIEQYRHGSEEVTLEIPGGMVDAGETPIDAAARELFEETGYAPREILFLGKTRPNPAIQNNWIHTFLARDVTFKNKPVFESTEHTIVRLVPLAEIPALIADGTINHSLVVVGFHWLSLYKDSQESGVESLKSKTYSFDSRLQTPDSRLFKIMKIQLTQLAHARSGDKGDTANVGLIALREEFYPLLVREVTAARVKQHFGPLCKGDVDRFELPNLAALNFLLHESLDGGGTLSLMTDAQGKTFSTALLRMKIDVPDEEAQSLGLENS